MSARSGLVGKNPPGPIWGHLRQFFPWTGKCQKLWKFCLFFLGGALAAIHPGWGNRYVTRTAACIRSSRSLSSNSFMKVAPSLAICAARSGWDTMAVQPNSGTVLYLV